MQNSLPYPKISYYVNWSEKTEHYESFARASQEGERANNASDAHVVYRPYWAHTHRYNKICAPNMLHGGLSGSKVYRASACDTNTTDIDNSHPKVVLKMEPLVPEKDKDLKAELEFMLHARVFSHEHILTMYFHETVIHKPLHSNQLDSAHAAPKYAYVGILELGTLPCVYMHNGERKLGYDLRAFSASYHQTHRYDGHNNDDKFESMCRSIMWQAIGALEHIHSHGIVHRDIKGANWIMFGTFDDPKIKLADFGYAHCTKSNYITHNHVGLWERDDKMVWHFAPELWGGEQIEISSQHDVYSLGYMLAYELLLSPAFDVSWNGYNKGKLEEYSSNYINHHNPEFYSHHDPHWDLHSNLPLFKLQTLPAWNQLRTEGLVNAKKFACRLMDPNPKTRPAIESSKYSKWFHRERELHNVGSKFPEW